MRGGKTRRFVLALCSALACAGAAVPASAQPKKPPAAAPATEANRLEAEAYAAARENRLDDSLARFEQVLALREKELPPGHPEIVRALDHVGDVYRALGRIDDALVRYERAHAIRESAVGKDHPIIADSLQNIATIRLQGGDLRGARERLERALAIRERTDGPEALSVGIVANNLGEAALRAADWGAAETYYTRALRLFEKAKGPDAADVAVIAGNLGSLHVERGDLDRAKPLLERALAIDERALGKEHTGVARNLGNLAELLMLKSEYPAAEPLLLRALAIREKAHGKDDPAVAVAAHNLASLYQETGALDRAQPLMERALVIWEKARGKDDPDVTRAVNNLATLYDERGELDRAVALFNRALASQRKVLGQSHPLLTISLQNLAATLEHKGDTARARAAYLEANEAAERHLVVTIATGSEQQKLTAIERLTWLTSATVSFHLTRDPSPEAVRTGLSAVLRRKGRALNAVALGVGALRAHLGPEDQRRLDELKETRAALAAALLRGAASGPEVAELERRQDTLEAQLSQASAEFRAVGRSVTIEDVTRALPEDAALVEIASFRPFDATRPRTSRWGAARYAAYVLRKSGEPKAVDLGDAAAIDADVGSLRAALADPRSLDPKRAAKALDARVTARLRPLLEGATRVIVSPDGALHLVPWAAFADEQGHWLVERFSFSYVTSGRDLLRFAATAPSREPATIVAAPAFDGAAPSKPEGAASADRAVVDRGAFAKLRFPPLPGTEGEASALGGVLHGSRVLTGARATKAALLELHGPRVLHVATHGFFFEAAHGPAGAAGSPGTRGYDALDDGAQRGLAVAIENPLVRSGLALAGANAAGPAKTDGLLVALEAAGLDLFGTKLVVLSACETGIGDVRAGEGVYGLRRALVLAGAETQVMSLWKVADAATQKSMVAYYRRLEAGEGRGDAMRGVALELLGSSETAHPFYWASFVVSGNPTPLSPKPAGKAPPPVEPSSRGCACELSRPAVPSSFVPAVGLVVLVLGRRRTRRARTVARAKP